MFPLHSSLQKSGDGLLNHFFTNVFWDYAPELPGPFPKHLDCNYPEQELYSVRSGSRTFLTFRRLFLCEQGHGIRIPGSPGIFPKYKRHDKGMPPDVL